MDKKEAIELIQDIQIGNINHRSIDMPMGSLAKPLYDRMDERFNLGIDYGAIFALMLVFDIDKDDL